MPHVTTSHRIIQHSLSATTNLQEIERTEGWMQRYHRKVIRYPRRQEIPLPRGQTARRWRESVQAERERIYISSTLMYGLCGNPDSIKSTATKYEDIERCLLYDILTAITDRFIIHTVRWINRSYA